MKMEGRYVRAVYDFSTTESSEINLAVGDLVRVVRQVDANWLCGVLNKQTGNFPASFVVPVDVPAVQPGEKLFLALRTFPAEESGDLGFSKGEIVLGVQAIDANWWQGRIGDRMGIFPITHVRVLEDVPPSSATNIPTSSPAPLSNATLAGPTQGTGSAPLAKVRATMDLTAQLDDELSFVMGDIINVIEVTDEDFAIGECSGRRGQFPMAFVEVIEGNLQAPSPPEEKRKSKNKFRWWLDEDDEDSGKNSVVEPSSGQPSSWQPAAPVTAQAQVHIQSNNTPRLNENQAVVQNGPTTQQHQQITSCQTSKPEFKQTHRRLGSYTQENTRSYDSDITPYGKTLYPFIAENPNELTFFDNDIVNLIRHVDDQWMEGELDGKRGIFPTAYVEIIVDCPYAEDIQISTEQEPSQVESKTAEKVTQPSEQSQPHVKPEPQEEPQTEMLTSNSIDKVTDADLEKYALVLCDFTPNSERELALTEGDTVTILDQLDEHWFEVKHDDGRIGLCPSSYVRVIESDACPSTPSPQSDSPTIPELDNNNSPKPQESSSSDQTTSTVGDGTGTVQGSVKPPVKPQTKPKPSLKPKPVGRSVRNKSPLTVEKPNIPPRRAQSVDVDNQYVPNPKPVAPARRLMTNKAPVFQKSSSMDATLDDLIVGEMNALKTTTTDVSQRSRSSSATSDYSSIEESRAGASPVVKSAPETNNNARSPDEKYMQKGTAVGSSMFFAAATSPVLNDTYDTKPPLERQRLRPTPNRPPPPPMTQTSQTGIQRQNSNSVRRPPPRPSGGPRPTPAPSKLPLGSGSVDYGPKPVPARPAPPRPNPARPPGSAKMSGNLMDFSPDGEHTNGLSEQDREIVADLDKRITEIQTDLEKCMQAQQELEHMLSVTEGAERAEAEDNLEFYNANIIGLSQEMQQLKASLYEVHPARAEADMAAEQRAAESQRRAEEEHRRAEEEKKHREEMRQKRLDTRKRVIEEILQTERDYLHGLTLIMEIFLSPEAEKSALIDVEELFGNMDEVIEVSQKLLTSLEGGSSGRDFDKQVIGDSFVSLKEDMKKVYAPYCRNHDEVIALLEKYEENEEIQDYFSRMLVILRQQITVFDLGSMLIKPVQRILKYPLLLNELIKATEDDHVDKHPLLNAINAMTDVAAAINEYKRRKDLVLKYRTDRDQKLTDKIARLTVHSTKKKLSRISQRIVGIQTVDESYNKEERKVASLEKGVRSLVRDVALYLDQLQETIGLQESIANDIADFYSEKSGQQEVEKFCMVHNVIASNLFHSLKFDLEGEVLAPLNHLLLMLSGPAKVMKKRHDKLLDYDNAQGKVKSSKDVELKMAQAELSRFKNDYEALNAQLLDELPRLYNLALEIVISCIARLAHVQQHYHQKALDEMYHLLSVPLLLGSDDTPLIEAFNIAHVAAVESLSNLSFIPRAFNPRLEDQKQTKASRRVSGIGQDQHGPLKAGMSPGATDAEMSQSEGQRVYLTQIYPVDRLFRVVNDVAITQPMDLACGACTVVGVIKEGDPMGNKDRWFVDNGAIKGFIMKRHLTPYQAAPMALAGAAEPLQPQTSFSPHTSFSSQTSGSPQVSPQGTPSINLMDLSSPPQEKPPITDPNPLDLDYPQTAEVAEPLDDKLDLSPSGVQSIDWGIPSAQPGISMTPMPSVVEQQAEPSPPPAYTEVQERRQSYEPQAAYYTAVYPFTARAPIEVSMEEGAIVKVLQQRDLDGNTEWWLVEVNGKQGYAPSNYLYQTTP